MKKLTCILLFTLAGLQLAAAEATSPNAAAQVEAGGQETAEKAVPSIALKNKSSFALEPNSRNPFWPIGWKPAPRSNSNSTEQAGPEIAPTAFVISSIIMGHGPTSRFAIINGKPMQEGQVFGLQMGSQVYQITVKTIEDGQVILQRRDQEFAVPLRRK